jgi:hypothetical protein
MPEARDLPEMEDSWFDGCQLEQGSVASPWRSGGPSAILIEEATTNLLTSNQSSLETDITGWQPRANCTISRSTNLVLLPWL